MHLIFYSDWLNMNTSRIVTFYHRQNFDFAHKLQHCKTLLLRDLQLNFYSPRQLVTWQLNWHKQIKVVSDGTFSWNAWRNIFLYIKCGFRETLPVSYLYSFARPLILLQKSLFQILIDKFSWNPVWTSRTHVSWSLYVSSFLWVTYYHVY
jgi:hypothetical protein